MASNTETINLKTLQRVDSHSYQIIDNASQVALYKYNSKLEKWEVTDIEGTLFLYRRSIQPYYRLIIVNRMNTTNYIESITSDMLFELHEPYLLYKTHSGDIIGSWFYEEKDLWRITKKIKTIIRQLSVGHPRLRSASDSDTRELSTSPDIMTLLSQAQKKYMETQNQKHSESQKHKSNKAVDFNSLNAHSKKKPPEKSVEVLNKPTKPLHSISQEDYSTSPRRILESTGSFDAERTKEFFTKFLTNVQFVNDSRLEEKTKVKDLSGCPPSCGEWTAPTRLSPLFSQDEISSPASDIISKDLTSKSYNSDHFPSYCKENLSSCKSSGTLNQKAYVGSDCDTHLTNMKQVLISHIQDNPTMVLKVHDAYVSSLRSHILPRTKPKNILPSLLLSGECMRMKRNSSFF